jgi:hypothetical protein
MAWLTISNNIVNTEQVSVVEIIKGFEPLAAVLQMAGGGRVEVKVKDWPAVQKALGLPEQS